MSVWRQQRTLDRLEDRLRSLELKCDDLDRAKKSIDMEFTELYDKVSHQMSRMAKRYSRQAKENDATPEVELNDDPFPGVDPISKSIMMRRGMQARRE